MLTYIVQHEINKKKELKGNSNENIQSSKRWIYTN